MLMPTLMELTSRYSYLMTLRVSLAQWMSAVAHIMKLLLVGRKYVNEINISEEEDVEDFLFLFVFYCFYLQVYTGQAKKYHTIILVLRFYMKKETKKETKKERRTKKEGRKGGKKVYYIVNTLHTHHKNTKLTKLNKVEI